MNTRLKATDEGCVVSPPLRFSALGRPRTRGRSAFWVAEAGGGLWPFLCDRTVLPGVAGVPGGGWVTPKFWRVF